MPNVVAPNTVSFGGPAALIAPDVAAQQLQLARQQQLIDLLKQRALTPDEQQTVTGSGPSRVVPYSPLQGLSKVLSAYLTGKSQDSVDAKNLDLSRQYATRMAQILGGGGGVDPSVAAPVSMAQGASQQPPQQAQDGSLTNTGGVGPTVQNAQRMDTMTQGQSGAAPGNNNFGLAKLLRGSVIEQMGGAPAAAAYWDSAKLPDAVKTNEYYGLPKADVSAAMARETAAKGQTLVRNASTLGRTNADGSFTPLFTAPDTKDNANITWQGGKPVAEQIQGLTAGVQAVAKAATLGKTEGTLTTGVGPDNKPVYSVGPPPGTLGASPTTQPTQTAPVPAPQGAAPGMQPTSITNPGNLRPAGASTGFQSFATPEDGLAALDKNLQSYGKQGVNTVSSIVSKWAPPSENDTGSYIADVSKRLGVSPTQTLDMTNPVVRQALSTAITLHEHGPSKVFASPQAQQAPIIRPSLSETDKALLDQGSGYYKSATTDAANVGTLRQMLSEIQELAANPANKFGPGAPQFAHVKALANNVGIDLTGAQTAQDVMGKLASNIVMSQLGQGNQTGSDAQMNQWIHANPNGEMTNPAILHVVPLLLQQLDLREARANVINKAVGQTQNFGQIPPVVNQFNKLASPPVVSLGMQLSNAQKNGTAEAFLKGLTAQQRALLPSVKQLDQIGAF